MIQCSFKHIKRDENKLAHVLARRAILVADTDVWLENLPPNLDDVSIMIYRNKITYLFLKKIRHRGFE